MNWDWVLTVAILLFLALIIWAKVDGKTIIEVLADIRDFFVDTGEDAAEIATNSYYG